jgi:hypothetical protein
MRNFSNRHRNTGCVVLNSTYEPINVTPPRNGLLLVLKGKAQTIKHHDTSLRSEMGEHFLPATIIMNYYVPAKRIYSPAVLNNRNLFTRDDHTCAYCRKHASELKKGNRLTRDHVHPTSRGGKNVWGNVVASCEFCNNKKCNTPLESLDDMKLHVTPYTPTVFDIYMKRHFSHIDLSFEALLED